MSSPQPTNEEVFTARSLCGANASAQSLDRAIRQIRVVKADDNAIIPDRKAALMKRISDMETELGRMTKLLSEIRADALHLTVE